MIQIEKEPEVSVVHHDTEMSNRDADLNSASDFNEEAGEQGAVSQIDSPKKKD